MGHHCDTGWPVRESAGSTPTCIVDLVAAGVHRGDRLGLLKVLDACAGQRDGGVEREHIADLQGREDGQRIPTYEPHARKLMVPLAALSFKAAVTPTSPWQRGLKRAA